MKKYKKSTKAIVAEAKRLAEKNKANGMTKEQAAEKLNKMFKSPTGSDE